MLAALRIIMHMNFNTDADYYIVNINDPIIRTLWGNISLRVCTLEFSKQFYWTDKKSSISFLRSKNSLKKLENPKIHFSERYCIWGTGIQTAYGPESLIV